MHILLGIVGILLGIPIAITIVVMICTTLLGGYVWVILHLCWEILLAVLAVILIVKLIKYLSKKV